MKLRPLFDRIIVERIEAKSKTAGGIIIPETAKEKPLEAIVIAVGKDVKEIDVGDKIFCARFSGNELKIEDKDYLILKESDVLGVVDDLQN